MRRLIFCAVSAFILFSGCELFTEKSVRTSALWNFDVFAAAFSENYSNFSIKTVDWDSLAASKRKMIPALTSDDDLYQLLSSMIDPLDDGHVWLSAGSTGYFESHHEYTYNFWSFESRAESYISSPVKTPYYNYGRLKADDSVGYINIESFLTGSQGSSIGKWVYELDAVIDSMLGCSSIILDLRHNRGGYRVNAEHIAARFASEKKFYLKSRTKSGPAADDFSGWSPHYIEPASSVYKGQLYLFTDRMTASAAEWMLLMLKGQQAAVHAGERTRGATGLVGIYELPNGWTFSVTVGQTAAEDGTSYEESGVPPGTSPTWTPSGDWLLNWFISR